MKSKGFTLIELIIACLLIGIASALGFNAYLTMRDDAAARVTEARLRQLSIAKEQFISEYGRIESELIWKNPSSAVSRFSPQPLAGGQSDTPHERRYNLLKRYIERPQAALSEFLPAGATLSVPVNVHGTFHGRDSRGRAITLAK